MRKRFGYGIISMFIQSSANSAKPHPCLLLNILDTYSKAAVSQRYISVYSVMSETIPWAPLIMYDKKSIQCLLYKQHSTLRSEKVLSHESDERISTLSLYR